MLSLHVHVMLNFMSLFISFLHIDSVDELQIQIDIAMRTSKSCNCIL